MAGTSQHLELQPYPNPASAQLNLSIVSQKANLGSYSIFDSSGRKVASKEVKLDKGITTVAIPIASLPIGTYFIQLINEAGARQGQFIKQ